MRVKDELGNVSEGIDASRLGKLTLAPQVLGNSLGSVEFNPSIDPEVEFSFILPWSVGDQPALEEFIRELAVDATEDTDDTPDAAFADMLELLGRGLPEERPRWEFAFKDTTTTVPEGETVQVVFNVSAPTRGEVAFALQARDTQDRSNLVRSDIVVAQVDEDGEAARLIVVAQVDEGDAAAGPVAAG